MQMNIINTLKMCIIRSRKTKHGHLYGLILAQLSEPSMQCAVGNTVMHLQTSIVFTVINTNNYYILGNTVLCNNHNHCIVVTTTFLSRLGVAMDSYIAVRHLDHDS